MLNKRHNLNSGTSKDKKRDLKEKQRQGTKKREMIDEENIGNSIF